MQVPAEFLKIKFMLNCLERGRSVEIPFFVKEWIRRIGCRVRRLFTSIERLMTFFYLKNFSFARPKEKLQKKRAFDRCILHPAKWSRRASSVTPGFSLTFAEKNFFAQVWTVDAKQNKICNVIRKLSWR